MPELQRLLDKPLNEADTRFKILDRILMEVLEWPNDSIDTEESVKDGFVDYTLRTIDGRAVSIIEAKRVGKLTLGTASTKVAALVLSGSVLKHITDPIRQAAGYASIKSVSTACVTDGRTWLFFQTNRRDGLEIGDGKGILFPSLASIANEFPRFHDLLSPSGMKDRLNLVQLNRAEGIRAAFEEEQIVVSPPDEARMLPRNTLSEDASLLFAQFFSNITSDSDPEMIKACFVESSESRKADIELQKIAQKLLNGIETIDTGNSTALTDEIERSVNMMRSERILLIGNKGSGKSTFLTRFFADVIPAWLSKQCLVLRIPLEAVPESDKDQVPGWAIRQIRDRLDVLIGSGESPTFDELRGVFWSDYNRLKNGPLAPLYAKDPDAFRIKFGETIETIRETTPERYVHALLNKAVKSDKKLPIIIFDNADQFPANVQDSIFQLANSLSLVTVALNIVPITDRTVWRLSKSGALQSYEAKSFYLPVPEAKQILQKRIDYVKLKLNADPAMAKEYFSMRGFRVKLESIDKFAQAVERIFVSNDFVSGLIGRLANFDIRRMLKIAERIFLSPEIKIDDVLRGSFGISPGRGEILRIHRAIIKGENDRYSPRENEFVYNLFWTDPSWPSSPLLALYIIHTLKARLANSRLDSVDSRHWTIGELSAFFEPAGAHPDQTLLICQRLADRGLIEALDPNVEQLVLGNRVAITESGLAHIDLVRTSDVYLEQMAMATGLNSRTVFNAIRDDRTTATSASFISLRRRFVDYLTDLDSQRLRVPNTKEYASAVEARQMMRSLGSTGSPSAGAVPTSATVTAPSKSIGTPFKRTI
ncbi:hypothetical protein [Brevundimonas subvibrioides]|uniref:hypothetical protein n=1 Tax=Brevundimonas subvibrioides TaxID=74313 RepID=UPI0022B3375D|nr:hypothetical protein [Brevundimonas subvibrioides]